jgi:putative membrane protein
MVKTTRLYDFLIWFVSILVPAVVALLLFTKWSQDKLIFDMRIPNTDPIVIFENLPFIEPLTFLPPIYAVINGLTAIFLVVAVYYIKNGKRKIHESLIKVCIALSLMFLVMYIAYHMTTDPTSYGGKGIIAYMYYFILITHILLSVIVIPLVLTSYSRAVQSNFKLHKKIAKVTLPIWLYVAVTGVIVYLMISPYY